MSVVTIRERLNSRNKLGIAGVHREVVENVVNGKDYAYVYWKATWHEPTKSGLKQKSKNYSVSRLGEDVARACAVAKRRAMVDKYYG